MTSTGTAAQYDAPRNAPVRGRAIVHAKYVAVWSVKTVSWKPARNTSALAAYRSQRIGAINGRTPGGASNVDMPARLRGTARAIRTMLAVEWAGLSQAVPRPSHQLPSALCPGIPSNNLSISRYNAIDMESPRTETITGELPVHLEGLDKEYGHFTALKSLDLTVSQGTSLGFLGPNGAGKSTTIKLMPNLIRPSRGRAALFGIDVRQEPTRALARIGAVIETPEFYGYLSPLETLAYVGRLRGMPKDEIERRSEAVLKEVKLTDWADHRIQEFSKGMKQRLAIAQALLNEPELLILDEPTSGLDPRGMAEVRDVIQALKAEGRTIFMSSHLLGEVQEVCDDVALLNHGELLIHGSVRDLSRGADTSTFQTTFLRSPTPQDLEALASVPGIVEIKAEGDSTVDLRISGGEEGQARVLEAMVSRGLRGLTYRPLGSSLEQLYLDRIQESDGL